jgi:pyruvate, water dikinase
MIMGFLDFFRRKKQAAAATPTLKQIWGGFQQVLVGNNEALVIMGDLEEKLSGHSGFDFQYLRLSIDALDRHLAELVASLRSISGGRWPELEAARVRTQAEIQRRLQERPPLPASPLLVRLEDAGPELLPALGGKAGNLARVKNEMGLPVPDGVVATLAAYKLFMDQPLPGESETLLERLRHQLASLDLADEALGEVSRELQALVLAQPIPPELARALVSEAQKLAGPGDLLAVRSSGAREDIAATFAGQYESFLGVRPEEVPERWRQVVASQFGERALIYLKIQGLLLEEAAMGVLIQRLVKARAAGVMFTADPERGDPGSMVVSATWGLAADLVGGKVSADEYLVSKEGGRLLQASYGRKEYRLEVRDGSLGAQAVAAELIEAPALEPEDLEGLARLARALGAHWGCPHDVEWAKDEAGKLYVVQSRPLHLTDVKGRCAEALAQVAATAEVLVETGRVGSLGVAAGPVFRLYGDRNPQEVPQGAVLVAPRTTPQLAPLLPRVAAIVTDVGSTTGHLALVAREYGVPALVDTLRAGELLPEGLMVTVDAYHGKVYRGRVEELLRYQTRQTPHLLSSPLHERLRSVVDLIIPLNLVDRRAPNFRPDNCVTYHDITRFAHEKAMQVMFGLMDSVEQGRVPALRLLKLKTDLPLNLHLVDLGEGLASHENPVPPADILSRPMRALWRGISHPGISWAGPVPVNFTGFLQVLGQTAIRPPERFWDKTYAIVAANFVNYACRLGYHFQSVDSYCGPVAADNYISFAFKGGAADETRRIRRVRLIATILEALGFEMEIHADVVRARFRKRPPEETEERLDLVGRLMAYVRQMDMLMSDDDIPLILAERFLSGHYERPGEAELRQEEKAGEGV